MRRVSATALLLILLTAITSVHGRLEEVVLSTASARPAAEILDGSMAA